ncbi:MAG: penicillin-binding protein [Desulfuromonas sp.]|uniref:penicillin-binding protein 1A n=1 Tax=Desulfuromonas sp. TaxID=892 RepID=UPI000CBCBF18|nr:PBP1A family penicillin-binding protein [Desulfuromonas sp.]PLX84050.1 MAG: penicillin-binding protein [Desulfuromonas sp.]
MSLLPLSKTLRIALAAGAALALAGVVTLIGVYLYVASTLPRVDTLADYRPPIVTRVLSGDGAVIAEFSRERRIVVPVTRLPERLIQAFVAAEDAHFFEHRGIDLISILRAALKNLKAGGIVQGGSTITQQVAKSLLLTPEKKFSRKFKEAILARRMERSLSKEEILFLYLNQIYLGHGAYGVQAAAENYFAKNVEELSLAECAMLAGLPQAPSRYSPYRHYERARDRQRYVLDRMLEEGYLAAEEAEAALAEELTIHPRTNAHIAGAAYFTEQVRRHLETTYGEEQLYTGCLEVHTTMNLAMQQAAQAAVRDNLHNHDKRQGYRGPQRVLPPEEVEPFLLKQQARLEKALSLPGTLIEGVLSGGDAGHLEVRVGSLRGEIPLSKKHWAGPITVLPAGTPPRDRAESGRTELPIGSVLLVKLEEEREDGSLLLSLEQRPEAQGAMVALAPGTGEVKAMVGGYDFGESQFNRVLQARRLPGSAIKPIIYAAALDKGYTPATIILDTPLIYKEKKESGEETEWKPKNYGKKFYGPTPLRKALAKSYNVITIKILEDIGVGYAANYARKLGITSPIARDLTLALGSSALTPLELATAYAVFANGGVRVTPSYITRVLDRDGRVLESVDPGDFPGGPEEGQRLVQLPAERVISPETAYLVTNLMESVVRHGTGWRAKALGRPVAGKTGTTNDLKDAWFAGFVPQLATVSWIGYDQERPLGKKETGSKAAAPAWVAFMKEATEDLPPIHFPVPDAIEFRPVDTETGLLTPEDNLEASIEVFAPGTAPTRYALDEKRPQAVDFFKLDLEEN